MKKILCYIIICIFFKVYVSFHETFLKSEMFKVETVVLDLENEFIKNELIGIVPSIKGNFIWNISPSELEEILIQDIRIEAVEVNKVIPDKVVIKVKTKTPKYYATYKNKLYSLDEENKLLAYVEEFPIKDAAIISIKEIDEIEQLVEILERMEGMQLETLVSQVYTINENYIEVTLIDGTKIKTNSKVDLDKYSLAEQLYLNLKENGNIEEYIDIRFNDYIVK